MVALTSATHGQDEGQQLVATGQENGWHLLQILSTRELPLLTQPDGSLKDPICKAVFIDLTWSSPGTKQPFLQNICWQMFSFRAT